MGFSEKYNRKIEIENENKATRAPMSPNTKSDNKKSMQSVEAQTAENCDCGIGRYRCVHRGSGGEDACG